MKAERRLIATGQLEIKSVFIWMLNLQGTTIMEYFFSFLLALAIFSFPFLLTLWLVRKTTFTKQAVLFLFLLILPFGFAVWAFCSIMYYYIKYSASGDRVPE